MMRSQLLRGFDREFGSVEHLHSEHHRHEHSGSDPTRVPWNPGGATPTIVNGCPLIRTDDRLSPASPLKRRFQY